MAAINLVNVNLLCDGNGYLVGVFIWRLTYPHDPNAVSASVLLQIVDLGPKTGDRGVTLLNLLLHFFYLSLSSEARALDCASRKTGSQNMLLSSSLSIWRKLERTRDWRFQNVRVRCLLVERGRRVIHHCATHDFLTWNYSRTSISIGHIRIIQAWSFISAYIVEKGITISFFLLCRHFSIVFREEQHERSVACNTALHAAVEY